MLLLTSSIFDTMTADGKTTLKLGLILIVLFLCVAIWHNSEN